VCSRSVPVDVLLPPALSSARRARAFVDEQWCEVHGRADRRQVHLLATELVTNAVRHGGPPIVLALQCRGDDGVLVSVSDGSDDPPERRDADAGALGGRGVRLVDLLSADWGVEHHHGEGRDHQDGTGSGGSATGKTVWCRLLT